MNGGRILAIVVAVLGGIGAGIQLSSPEALGISPVVKNWVGVFCGGLVILQGFLPKLQGPDETTEEEH